MHEISRITASMNHLLHQHLYLRTHLGRGLFRYRNNSDILLYGFLFIFLSFFLSSGIPCLEIICFATIGLCDVMPVLDILHCGQCSLTGLEVYHQKREHILGYMGGCMAGWIGLYPGEDCHLATNQSNLLTSFAGVINAYDLYFSMVGT